MSRYVPSLAGCTRVRTVALAGFAVLSLGACGRELLGGDDEPVGPISALAAPAEVDDVRTPQNPDVDAQGRLVAAEGLVSGFEVPRGMKLISRQTGFLTFEVAVTAEALMEFYSGVDRSTGRRFAERRYSLEELPLGFDVRHTRDTVERLRLEERYREGHMYIAPLRVRLQEVRVHLTPPPPSPDDDPFMPKLPPAGPGGEGVPKGGAVGRGQGGSEAVGRLAGTAPASDPSFERASSDGGWGNPHGARETGAGGASPTGVARGGSVGGSDSGPNGASGSSGGGGSAPGLAPLAPSNVGTSPLTPTPFGQPGGGPAGKRYGPYPSGGHRVAPAIRQWQSAHPGERFID